MADRVGLLGGSFDPVHNGHLAIVRSFLDSGYIDQLWILPSPSPPHKVDRELTSLTHRKKMLELAFDGFERVQLCDVEANLPDPSYTVRTLEYLQNRYPKRTFYLCMGSDSFAELENWYRPDEIVRRVELLVALRPGTHLEHTTEHILRRAHFIEHEPFRISSSELRDRLREGEEVDELIPESVLHYIKQEQLYTRTR